MLRLSRGRPGSKEAALILWAQWLAEEGDPNRYRHEIIAAVKVEMARAAAARKGDIKWSPPNSPTQWARVFGVCYSTIIRRFKAQDIRNKKLSPRSYRVAVDDLPAASPE